MKVLVKVEVYQVVVAAVSVKKMRIDKIMMEFLIHSKNNLYTKKLK